MDVKAILELTQALAANGSSDEFIIEALKAAGIILPAAEPPIPVNGLAAAQGLGLITPPEWAGLINDTWRFDGYTLEGLACPSVTSRYMKCAPTGGDEANNTISDPVGVLQSQGVHPIWAESVLGCSTFGSRHDQAWWKAAINRSLDLCQWSSVAFELWTGTQSEAGNFGNRFLASLDAIDVVSNTAVGDADPGVDPLDTADEPTEWDHLVVATDIIQAVATMEDALSKCTCSGIHVIHTSPRNVTVMAAAGFIDRVGSRIFTKRGTLIVDDAGYPGTGPEGAPPADANTNYIYGTSQLSGIVGTNTVFPMAGESEEYIIVPQNNIAFQGLRPAMISWLCCHFVARVKVQ